MTRCKLLVLLLVVWVFSFHPVFCDTSTAPEYHPNTTLMLPMRDGTLLPTDIYLPQNVSAKHPVILVRNPSGRKALPWVKYSELAKAGFIVAIQDTRSAIDAQGKTMPYFADGWGEQQDGYDSVEAIAKYEHSNGKVGTLGCSATGITQLLLAPTAPPSLCAQYIGVAASSLYHHAIFPGGTLQKNQVEGWLKLYAKDPSMNQVLVKEPFYNDFWKGFNCNEVCHLVKTPALLYTGWYDTFLQGTIDAFVARNEMGGEGAKGKQKLIIGPWTHYWPQSMRLGDYQAPKHAETAPWDISPLSWFNHYLKGEPASIDAASAITYYVMGPFDNAPSKGNVWKSSNSWPVPSKPLAVYFADDSKLVFNTVPERLSAYTYLIDRDKPVPTVGGCNLFLESGPKDQREVEAHKDVLVFTSEPLTEDLEVTGQLFAKIFHKPVQGEADIVVKLCDVYPDGKSILVADGIYRISNNLPGVQKNSGTKQPQLSTVDLWSTSMVFAKGHRIRVSVCGSNYPRFEKLEPVKDKMGVGCLPSVTFYSGGEYSSHLLLPVVE